MGLNLYSSSTVIIIFHQNVGILLNFSKNGRNYKRKSENIFFCVPIELHTVQYMYIYCRNTCGVCENSKLHCKHSLWASVSIAILKLLHTVSQEYMYVQALKYFLQSRLTKCPMPLSLGRTKCMIMSDDFEVSLARK